MEFRSLLAKERLTAALGQVPVVSQALRWFANQYPEGSVVRISQGLAKDLLWKRHHRYVNGYWIGHYEFEIQAALKRWLTLGDTFFDVGANAGFFTLIGSRIVGTKGRCVAFDPSPVNAASILDQIKLNSLDGCQVVAEAVSNFEGEAEFCFASPGSSMGHLGTRKNGEEKISVKVTTLDSAVIRFGAPNFIKMDIEGAEGEALRGARKLLSQYRPIWLIEIHGPECEKAVREILLNANYSFRDLNNIAIPSGQTLPGHFVALP